LKVFINAGHGELNSGKKDPGAIGPTGLQEATQTMEVALRVRDKLKSLGLDVLLIQDGDLWDVSNKSNKWGADYLISIHCNAHTAAEARGIETYYYKPGGMGEKMARAVQTELIKATGLVDRGVKAGNLHMVREPNCPAILVEAGFISNPQEEALMRQSSFDEKVAEAICVGFCKAVDLKEEIKVGEKSLKEKLSPDDTYLTVRVRESKVEEAIKEINKLGYACKKLDLA
jgi:N-acetylmuramoyl-L-alanine amidase